MRLHLHPSTHQTFSLRMLLLLCRRTMITRPSLFCCEKNSLNVRRTCPKLLMLLLLLLLLPQCSVRSICNGVHSSQVVRRRRVNDVDDVGLCPRCVEFSRRRIGVKKRVQRSTSHRTRSRCVIKSTLNPKLCVSASHLSADGKCDRRRLGEKTC